jgi:hypothetical protein
MRFKDLLRRAGTEEDFLRRYPHPALLLEPFSESSTSSMIDTPDPDAQTPSEATWLDLKDVLAPPPELVHPKATAVWLVKSNRNPFAGMITIGRARNNDVILQHPAISKMHAILHQQGRDWLIEDRSSTNGTFLNESKLASNERFQVTDGVRLRLGTAIVARFFEPSSLWNFCNLLRGSSSDLQPLGR